jgi:hypothetical protein
MKWPKWLSTAYNAIFFIIIIGIPIGLHVNEWATKTITGYWNYDVEYKATLKGTQSKSIDGCKMILLSPNLKGNSGIELWYHRRACDGMNDALLQMGRDERVCGYAPVRSIC